MEATPRELQIYITRDSKRSFSEWRDTLAYLEAALEPADIDMLLTVFTNLVEARSSQHESTESIRYQCDRLQHLLNSQGTATLTTLINLINLINLLGFQLSITPKPFEP